MEDIRAALRDIAEESATLTDRRDELVAQARQIGMTWVEIADILGMTPHGLRKAQNRNKETNQ